ncbi:MAG: hypothetical protein O3A93_09430 [Chloroflexi bacterium]|nr:hypothetical protein [Chloroflexota bacterium]MDA1271467.1 hypothetical protein [Chloroflexota bacterium]PKB58625.1 MAG: hypothetical protein BZY83_06110 [SAR202 cluster bacterium Casp-Chloro-G2]
MSTEVRNWNRTKTPLLKQVGLALASLWVIMLVAAVSATIYREFDGPTVRDTMAQNVDLSTTNSSLKIGLDSAQRANAAAQATIDKLNAEKANLRSLFESYIAPIPLLKSGP